MEDFTITSSEKVSLKRVAELLNGALDPYYSPSYSVRYWCEEIKGRRQKPASLAFRFDEKTIYPYLDYPLNKGGALYFKELEGGEERGLLKLDLLSIRHGLELMCEKWPKQWADFIEENDDCETSDVFVQCCLLGDVIYG